MNFGILVTIAYITDTLKETITGCNLLGLHLGLAEQLVGLVLGRVQVALALLGSLAGVMVSLITC